MLQKIKDWLYELITSSGIIFIIMPILQPIMARLAVRPNVNNFKIIDAGGATMTCTKYEGKIFPPFPVERIAGIKSVTIRNDDVMLCGYPKSGCHWMYEILHMLLSRKAELTKYGKILGGMIDVIPPFIRDSLPSPRVLNTHVLYEDLPIEVYEKKTKIIYTVRSPKDTVVSFYNHLKALSPYYNYSGSFDNLFKLFMSGKMEYGMYFDYILAWEKAIKDPRDNPILVVEYEKLKGDTLGAVKDVAGFLGISISDGFARQVVEASQFTKMKEKRIGNKLFRKGEVGDWRNWLTDDQSAQIDKTWQDRMSDCFYQPELS